MIHTTKKKAPVAVKTPWNLAVQSAMHAAEKANAAKGDVKKAWGQETDELGERNPQYQKSGTFNQKTSFPASGKGDRC